ncbi:hypothetical protein ACJTM1_16235 [Bacillus sp. GX]|uniref:hypothetical protein n=1 Tax=Bacillus TaxID=1386 RepID=UPI00065BFCB9|nr:MULTISPECIES: hypothetical protein [Bacillus]KMP33139.1 hypothetical protein TU52_16865 [Bacillus cereus]MDA2027685.1 hypothetical protein [Bacillus cereus group sp. Bcc03]MDA2714370.1 hypothetical protein [Bacillus cereus group sp. Bc025]MDC6159071.1 hypothetical protein [Bacillus albus]MDD8008548.1 hypothetical protein [Bacillus albus]
MLLCIFASLFRFKILNQNNESYKVVNDEFLSNSTFEDRKGVTFHPLDPLEPIKTYDPYEDREVMTYVLPLDITNTTNQDINLLSNQFISNTMFYSKIGEFYNAIPYSIELPKKYQFDPVIPAGKTVRGYIGTNYFIGDDLYKNYKNFSNESTKVKFISFMKDKKGKYHELEIPIN